MATTYPGTIQTFTDPAGTSPLTSPDHAGLHTNINDTMEAVQTRLGVGAGTPTATNLLLVGNGNGTASWGGTVNGATLGTPVVDHFTSSGTGVPSIADRGLAPTVITLTDAADGTITPNAASGQIFHLILGTAAGNRTLAAPANATEGQAIAFRIKQNAAVTGTLVWNAIYRWSGGTGGTAVLGTTASSYNYFGFRYNSIDTKWDDQGSSKNIV